MPETTTWTIELTAHAVERFHERVRPGLTLAGAEEELARLVLAGEVTAVPPAWHVAGCAQLAPWYLAVADILLPLKPHWSEPGVLVATTCLPKGSLSAEARRHRTMSRRARRTTRRATRVL